MPANTSPTFVATPGGGYTVVSNPSAMDFGNNVFLVSGGKILVTGNRTNGITATSRDMLLERFNADGTLDTSFGSGGTVIAHLSDNQEVKSAAIQADGKILVAGYSQKSTAGFNQFTILRYNADGTLDTTFDVDGVVTTAIHTRADQINAIVPLSSGKILVAGFSQTASASGTRDFEIARYNADGSLDTTFNGDGNNDGWISTPVSGTLQDRATSMVVLSSGKILVLGFVVNGTGGQDAAVVQYNTDGSLDTGFGTGGKLVMPTSSSDHSNTDQWQSVIETSDGKILLAGYTTTGLNNQSTSYTLIRLNANGTVDTSFNGDGNADGKIVTQLQSFINIDYKVIEQPDGKFLVAGLSFYNSTSNYGVLVRYNHDGSLDTGFGTGGVVFSPFPAPSDTSYQDVVVQPDGKIVVTGFRGGVSLGAYDVVVARYNSNGTLDTSFGQSSPDNTFLSYSIGADPILLAPGLTVYDAEFAALNGGLGDYGGATMTLARSGGASSEDHFGVSGALTIANPANTGSGTLLLHGTALGTFTNGASGLVVTLAAGTTAARVNEAIHLVTYYNTNPAAQAFPVQMDLVFSDGTSSAKASVHIAVSDTPQIHFESSLVDEQVGQAQVSVKLDHASTGTVTVHWSTADGSAVAGQDYVATSGTLTFLPGETSKTIPVTIINDSSVESSEYLKITFSNLVGAVPSDGLERAIFIAQNDAPVAATPTLAAAQLATQEGDRDVSFFVSLDAPSAQTVTVNYATVPGSAGSADFTAVSGTLTFLPGETTKQVKVLVTDDGISESTETFSLSLTGAVNANIGSPLVTAYILDNDSASTGVAVNGTDGPDVLLGSFYNDTLIGGSGNDILISDQGNDSALGGTGDDFYLVDHAGFTVVENAGEGNDTVLLDELSSYTLPANVENLRLFSGSQGDTLNATSSEGSFAFSRVAGTSPIVGTWTHTGTEAESGGGLVAITFLADGTYMLAEDGSSVIDPTGQDGMERGTYTWNESSGAFTKVTTVDTNGQWGLSNTTINDVRVEGDTLLIETNEGITAFSRVTSDSNALVGSWSRAQGAELTVITLLADGQYMLAADGSSIVDPSGQDGMERGTWAWNPTTGAFTHTTTVDTNGEWGLSHGGPLTLTLQGVTATGNELPNLVVGNNAANTLNGMAGDDTLVGSLGNDTLDGGGGNDTAVFSGNFLAYKISSNANSSDIIISGPEGVDTLRNIEILQFADNTFTIKDGTPAAEVLGGSDISDLIRGRDGNDTVDGGAGNDALYGDEGTDTLSGGTGNDLLDGGTGNDNMTGGTGDDTYIVDSADDVVTETNGPVGLLKDPLADNPGGGVDTVIASVNYTLGSFLEKLQLATGAGNLTGAGNALANTITGNEGNNQLTGNEGSDTIEGGEGVDTATYSGVRGLYAIQGNGLAATVGGEGSTDTLNHVERLQFSDGRVAIDMQGAAGLNAKMVGALFGSAAIGDQALVGQYLAQYDAGLTNEEVTASALASERFAQAAGSHSNTAFVNYVYHNVAGVAPDAGTLSFLVGLLDTGYYTQAAMATLAAEYVPTGNLVAYTLATASVSTGGSGNDTLTGTAGANAMFGREGNDVLTGLAGNDLISGGAGIDRAVFSTAKSASIVTHTDLGLVVTTGAETDTLLEVERITYSNISVAYDISGNAGMAAKLVGAIFGVAALQDESLVGTYLALLDSGSTYEQAVGAAAASTRFGTEAGGHSNAQFVDRVYFNIAGFHPDAATAASLVQILETPGYTQAYLGTLAADTTYNVANVNLTGLAQTGLEYTVV